MRLTGSSQGPGWALSRFIEAGTFLLPPLLHHYHHPLTMTTKQKIKKKKKKPKIRHFLPPHSQAQDPSLSSERKSILDAAALGAEAR